MSRLTEGLELWLAPRDDEEGLFSRDVDGQLVRLDNPTEADYLKMVTLEIDGKPVTVPLAEPLKDAQGTVILDVRGRTTPRYLTIYDAALRSYVQNPGDEARLPIPILCHQPHMTPAAVCRICMVQVYGQKRGKLTPERRLLPACQHQVKDGMKVFTREAAGKDGDRVRRAINVLTELLIADCPQGCSTDTRTVDMGSKNEFQKLADLCGLTESRFNLDSITPPCLADAPPPPKACGERRPVDESSPVFLVNHSACILCERCIRACSEVKQNNVIGRTGKGAAARIGFDLNDPMGNSGCVQCGECMVSCPTNAIVPRDVVKLRPKEAASSRKATVVTAPELEKDPIFSGIPSKFLYWQHGLVERRHMKAGEFLCREGDPGNTAFILIKGEVGVRHRWNQNGDGSHEWRTWPRLKPWPDFIVGEMACLSGSPHTADIIAAEDGEVLEVRRNVLDRLMRTPARKQLFQAIYQKRSLGVVLRSSEVFQNLPDEAYQDVLGFVGPLLSFVSVNPGQTIFGQNEAAGDFYVVRLGHVRVATSNSGGEPSVVFKGAGESIGEIGLLALSPLDAAKGVDQVIRDLEAKFAKCGPDLAAAFPPGMHPATYSAMDHVELAKLSRSDFLPMIRHFPRLLRELVKVSLKQLGDRQVHRLERDAAVREHVSLGLYQARSLLVVDLEKCTRCDECTRACVDQHGTESHGTPIPRMLRDGLKVNQYLVATSCRSCKDAYCMIGCPVDAIHRGKHQQIVIEDHCIGCGLCEKNCPYGSIATLKDERRPTVRKAACCDLCDGDSKQERPAPRCVYACPHDAAFRITGEGFLQKVLDTQ